MDKKIIAVFDFDGTITEKDTFIEFIKFSKGKIAFYFGILLFSPILVAFKLKLYPNWKAKEMLFRYFFKGMNYDRFCLLGKLFVGKIDSIVRPNAIKEIENHLKHNDKVYVISASVDKWMIPWCEKTGIKDVIGTQIEVNNEGLLTGRFLSKNCYGQEKVNRLLEKETDRSSYILYAYGDSRGDKELIEFADKGWYNKFK